MRFMKLLGGFIIEMPETKHRKRIAFMLCAHDRMVYGSLTIGSFDANDYVTYGFDTEHKPLFYREES